MGRIPSTTIINKFVERARTRRALRDGYREFALRWQQLADAHNHVVNKVPDDGIIRIELLAYFPIAIVALLEAYTRGLIADLIDAGEPFAHNARDLKEASFDLDAVLAIDRKRMSPGDFIAHSLPISSLDHIDNYLSILIQGDTRSKDRRRRSERFLERLKSVPLYFSGRQAVGDKLPPINDAVYDKLREMFQMRHELCHEMTHPDDVIDGDEKVAAGLDCAVFFAMAADVFLGQIIKAAGGHEGEA
jgi:hypothetical protein